MKHCLLLIVLLAGCKKSEPAMPRSWATFECKDRRASYFVVGGMAGQEAGAQMDCNVQGPRVLRWVEDKDGTKTEDSAAITPGEFNDVWTRINGVGWQNLGDCAPDLGNDIPVYTYDIGDWDKQATFECTALDPPFPYNTLIDELNQLASAKIKGDRGKNQMDIDDSDLED
jgi:hypothetical protein